MKKYVAGLTAYLTFMSSVAQAVPCNVLLRLESEITSVGAKAKDAVQDTRRLISPSRYLLGYRNLDLGKIDDLVAKYQDDSSSQIQWKIDFPKRVEVGDYTPEEWFAYLMLSKPPQTRKLVELLATHDGLWVRDRAMLEKIFRIHRTEIEVSASNLAQKFTFPGKLTQAEFERANASLIVAISRADFKSPSTMSMFYGSWKGFADAFIEAIRIRDYLGAPRKMVRGMYEGLVGPPIENELERENLILEIRNGLDHPQTLEDYVKNLSEADRAALRSGGTPALYNKLLKAQGAKIAKKFIWRVVANSLRLYALVSVGRSFMPGGLSNVIRHGKGVPVDDNVTPEQRAQNELDAMDKLINQNFYPLENVFIQDIPENLNDPKTRFLPNPCDPERYVQNAYTKILETMTPDDFDANPDRDRLLNNWRQSIRRYWFLQRPHCQGDACNASECKAHYRLEHVRWNKNKTQEE